MVSGGSPVLAWLRRHPYGSLGLVLLLLTAGLFGAANLFAWREFRAASQALQEEQFDQAGRHIDACLRVWPRSIAVHRLAARIARWQRDYPRAEEHLNACRRLQPATTEDVQLEWLLLRCEQGEKDALRGMWSAVETDQAESEEILATLARRFMRQLHYPLALRCLNAWLQRRPDTARALDWRGWVWEQLHQQKAALADYQHALELDPGRSSTRLRRAHLQLARRDVAAALSTLQPLCPSKPDDPQVLLVLAGCRALEGKAEEAGRLLDAVLAARPDDTAALLERSDVALQLDQPEQAEAFLRRGLALNPADPEMLYILHRCLRRQPGRQEEADRCLEQYNQLTKDLERLNVLLRSDGAAAENAETASETGRLLLRVYQESVGLYWLHQALEINPLHRPTHEVLAAYYEKQNDPEQAREHRRLAAISSALSQSPAITSPN
jgi:tetratricopeptide (TPR) repeat protein